MMQIIKEADNIIASMREVVLKKNECFVYKEYAEKRLKRLVSLHNKMFKKISELAENGSLDKLEDMELLKKCNSEVCRRIVGLQDVILFIDSVENPEIEEERRIRWILNSKS